MSTTEERQIYQPLHPSMLSKLDPEYIDFHNKYLQYIPRSESVPWHPSQRTAPSPSAGVGAMKKVEIGKTEDFDLGKGWQMRVFTPEGDVPDGGWGVVVWCHGGGWVVGGLDSENGYLTHMCKYVNCVVITVNYRHAPEDTYPTAINDVVEALEYIVSKEGSELFQINTSRLALGGLSAGGCLTAILSMRAAQLTSPVLPVFQFLICPVIDSTATTSTIWSESQHAPWLTPSRMTWYREKYFPSPSDAAKWDASPNFAPRELLAKSPKTFIAVADCDLLAHEALEYGKLLKEVGVDVEMKVVQGGTHSILILAGLLTRGKKLVDDSCVSLANALGTTYTYSASS